MNRRLAPALAILVLASGALTLGADQFDHRYASYAEALAAHVHHPLVDYAALRANRVAFDRAVAELDSPAARAEREWPRAERLAFWINAYNALTLRAIVDHYPIRSGLFTLQPRNSIRQIDGVWTDLQWNVAGRRMTLDDIEHRLLRPEFKDARVHFAINCASLSCPPLSAEPYRADVLDMQMDRAARGYLASAPGLQVDGQTVRVSSIFDWYGEDFVAQYAPLVPGTRDPVERAIFGAVVTFGPPEAVSLARSGRARVAFLDYDWSLNDVAR
ncbi:MAG: DUF547 domain-containing protein [Acidobacteriota bacterium]|nr:DUF547 domain-containing protein [Acidobacteriota bacterium]